VSAEAVVPRAETLQEEVLAAIAEEGEMLDMAAAPTVALHTAAD
jgi:hypothetical protein